MILQDFNDIDEIDVLTQLVEDANNMLEITTTDDFSTEGIKDIAKSIWNFIKKIFRIIGKLIGSIVASLSIIGDKKYYNEISIDVDSNFNLWTKLINDTNLPKIKEINAITLSFRLGRPTHKSISTTMAFLFGIRTKILKQLQPVYKDITKLYKIDTNNSNLNDLKTELSNIVRKMGKTVEEPTTSVDDHVAFSNYIKDVCKRILAYVRMCGKFNIAFKKLLSDEKFNSKLYNTPKTYLKEIKIDHFVKKILKDFYGENFEIDNIVFFSTARSLGGFATKKNMTTVHINVRSFLSKLTRLAFSGTFSKEKTFLNIFAHEVQHLVDDQYQRIDDKDVYDPDRNFFKYFFSKHEMKARATGDRALNQKKLLAFAARVVKIIEEDFQKFKEK